MLDWWTPNWSEIAWDITLCMIFYAVGIRQGRKQR